MKIDGDLAEIIGIHMGDGCISKNSRYQMYYLGGDISEEKEYHDKWVSKLYNKKIMIPLYKKPVNYKEHPKVGVYGFYIFDKKIVEFFESLGIKAGPKVHLSVPNEILSNSELGKRFLRGIFDTDGNLYFDRNRSAKNPINNRPTIKLVTISKELINSVYSILKKEGFSPRFTKPYKGKTNKNTSHGVLIYRLDDVRRYISEIGFRNPKHSSRWELYKSLGYYIPRTTLAQRRDLISKQKLYNTKIFFINKRGFLSGQKGKT